MTPTESPTPRHPTPPRPVSPALTCRLKRVEHLKRTVLSSFMPSFQTKGKADRAQPQPTNGRGDRSREGAGEGGEGGGVGSEGGGTDSTRGRGGDLHLDVASTNSAASSSTASRAGLGAESAADPNPLHVPPSALASTFLAAALEQSRAQSAVASSATSAPTRTSPTAAQPTSHATPPRTRTTAAAAPAAAAAAATAAAAAAGGAATTTPRSHIPVVIAAYAHAINACANAHAHSVDRPTDPDEAATDPELLAARSQAQSLLADLRDRYGKWLSLSPSLSLVTALGHF